VTSNLLLSLLIVGAPGPKDPPKQDVDLAGEWTKESESSAGEARPVLGKDLIFRFDPDGKCYVRRPGEKFALHSTYILDRTANPAGFDLDLYPDRPGRLVMRGIAKSAGDTLTNCLSNADPPVRPKTFEPAKGSATVVYVFKRAKPKD
jgi:uncharacterized protein (TIGR03067 family)